MPKDRDTKISARGVYYDLSLSPYVVTTAYGDTFRFSSRKKMEIFQRDLPGELNKLERLLERNRMGDFLPVEIVALLGRSVSKAFYNRVEGRKDG